MHESSLAWLDLNEEARQKMQDHLALLNEPDTMDQLGIGQVRDVFSDLFFPGVSTLWRRARYMVFIPWIYKQLEERGTAGLSGEVASRRMQTRLIRSLKEGEGENTNGLIGARKDEPQRMPDELIWNGLQTWGVRRRDGSRAKYWRMLESAESSAFSIQRGDFEEALDAESGSWWHPRLPLPPDDYLVVTTFDLESAEAAFLRDQLAQCVPESLLAKMTQDPPIRAGGDFPWENSRAVERLSPEMKETMDHARVFSYGLQGTGLLYSYLVARKRKAANAEDLAKRLHAWSARLRDEGALRDIRDWRKRRDAFWRLVRQRNPGLRIGTEDFVDEWMLAYALRSPDKLLKDQDAVALIRDREWSVKRHFARLSSDKALDRARDESGTDQLGYRWVQGSQIIDDIVAGLKRGSD